MGYLLLVLLVFVSTFGKYDVSFCRLTCSDGSFLNKVSVCKYVKCDQ